MKVKKLFLMMMLCITSVFFLSSCSGNSESVEYWKFYLAERWHVEGKNLKKEYLQNRFETLAPNPDEYQWAYYIIATNSALYDNVYKISNDEEMRDKVQKTVDGANTDRSYYAMYDGLTQNARLNMKSHPELYVENACKIIGPIDDLKKSLASHVEVKEVEKGNIADFDFYNVLYSIDEKFYIICCITEKGNGQSELQEVYNSKSINEVLDYWQAMH